MFGNTVVALAAGFGIAIWVYKKTSRRGGGEFKKAVAPAVIAGILGFLISLTIVSQVL